MPDTYAPCGGGWPDVFVQKAALDPEGPAVSTLLKPNSGRRPTDRGCPQREALRTGIALGERRGEDQTVYKSCAWIMPGRRRTGLTLARPSFRSCYGDCACACRIAVASARTLSLDLQRINCRWPPLNSSQIILFSTPVCSVTLTIWSSCTC